MKEIYIAAAARTPIGRFGSAFKDVRPAELGAAALKEALKRANVEGKLLDLYIIGNVLRGGQGQAVSRQVALLAGLPEEVDGFAVDMVCSSGMAAVIAGAMAIKAEDASLVAAGGTESMSQAALAYPASVRWGIKHLIGRELKLMDLMLTDGLIDPVSGEMMGIQTEKVAAVHNVTREELDEVAYNSNKRAAETTENGSFAKEIVPFTVKTRKGDIVVDKDEGIRAQTTMESLGKLRPAFRKDGVLTAGNSSQISDGAAMMILSDESALKKYNLTPEAKILGYTWLGGQGWEFSNIPGKATDKLLKQLKMKIDDFDYFETNEAFAINNVLLHRHFTIDYERINPFGGAVALGHPIGASGARIIGTLMNVLKTKHAKRGIAMICHGLGGATAVAVERV